MYNRLSERYKFFKVAKGTELYGFISDFVDRLCNLGLDVNEVELEEKLGFMHYCGDIALYKNDDFYVAVFVYVTEKGINIINQDLEELNETDFMSSLSNYIYYKGIGTRHFHESILKPFIIDVIKLKYSTKVIEEVSDELSFESSKGVKGILCDCGKICGSNPDCKCKSI